MPEKEEEESDSEEKKPKIKLTMKGWAAILSVPLYTMNIFLKPISSCCSCIYHFGIFLALVILISFTEGETRCSSNAVNMVAYVTGFKFLWCTFE